MFGKIWLFSPLTWHFMSSRTPVKFTPETSVVVLLVLRATLVLPFARVPLLKLQKQGATIVLPSNACHLAQMSPDLYSKGSCLRIVYITLFNFGTASYLVLIRRQPPCRDSLASLANHSCLSNRTGASVEVVRARCQTCSSKLCLFSGPFFAQISTRKAGFLHTCNPAADVFQAAP